MFKKQFAAIILAVLMMATLGNAEEIGGVNMPASLSIGKTKLILNGAGVRKKFFIGVYVGGLYLKDRSHDPKEIIEADEQMAIRLHVTSSMLTSKRMEKATREGFEKATGGNIEPIKVQIDEFCSVFKKEIKEDDVYDLFYMPEKGVEVYINGEYTSITKGLAFKKALFGIWLSNRPAQKSLKKAMLGE